MLQRDYILRLIQEFAKAMALLLQKKKLSERRTELQRMYDQYVGPYDLLFNATTDQMMDHMLQFAPEERLQRMEMLAELYMAEADTVGKITADQLLEKAYFLYDYIETEGRTLSFDHQRKMADIRQRLEKSEK